MLNKTEKKALLEKKDWNYEQTNILSTLVRSVCSQLKTQYVKEHYKIHPKPIFSDDGKPKDPTNVIAKLSVIEDVMYEYHKQLFPELEK